MAYFALRSLVCLAAITGAALLLVSCQELTEIAVTQTDGGVVVDVVDDGVSVCELVVSEFGKGVSGIVWRSRASARCSLQAQYRYGVSPDGFENLIGPLPLQPGQTYDIFVRTARGGGGASIQIR